MINSRMFMMPTARKSKTVVLAVAVLLMMGFAASTEVKDAEIVETVDRDGDGKISDFKIEIKADLRIDEAGAEYGDDVVPGRVDFAGIVGDYLEPKGDPKFHVKAESGGQYRSLDIWASPSHRENEKQTAFRADYDYGDVENFIQQNSQFSWVRDIEKIVEGERKITGLKVEYLETDTCSDCESPLDTSVDTMKIDLSSPVTLEKPSKDKEKEVSIRSNTDAELYINGERKGMTPWEGDLPVDISEDELVDIRLEKDGYVTKSAEEDLEPPASRTYQLEKVKKPLVVDSEPQGADVKVNGKKIGETPVSKNYWVEEDLEVRVKGDNNTETFSGINTKWSKTVDLNGTESSGGNGGGLPNDFGVNFDTQYYDDLMTELPDLEGLTEAQFNTTKQKVSQGEEVEFDASGSYSLYRNITRYRWRFGDGGTTRAQDPEVTHSYSSPGSYTVNLTVVNDNGTRHSTVKQIRVENLKPQPDFTLPGKRLESGETVTFNAGPSKDRDGSIVSYSWKTGDGASLRGQKVSYAYSSTGSYTVELEVTDQHGGTATTTRTVNVQKPNVRPSASFAPSKTELETGEEVKFDASGSIDPDGSISTYAWSLGNGFSKTGQEISYNYSRAGNYTVGLDVVDSAGLKATATRQITVRPSSDTGQTGRNTGTISQPPQNLNDSSNQTASGSDSGSETSEQQQNQDQQNEQEDSQQNQDQQEDQQNQGILDSILSLFTGIF